MIDVGTANARRLSGAFDVFTTSDRYAIGFPSATSTSRPWVVADLATGTTRTVASTWITETDTAVSLGDDRFVVDGWSPDHTTLNTVIIDAGTGGERPLLAQSGYAEVARLRHEVVSPRWVAVSTQLLWRDVMDGFDQPDILDRLTGRLLPAAAAAAIGQP